MCKPGRLVLLDEQFFGGQVDFETLRSARVEAVLVEAPGELATLVMLCELSSAGPVSDEHSQLRVLAQHDSSGWVPPWK